MKMIDSFKEMHKNYVSLSKSVKNQQKKDLQAQREMSKEFHEKKLKMKKYFEN